MGKNELHNCKDESNQAGLFKKGWAKPRILRFIPSVSFI